MDYSAVEVVAVASASTERLLDVDDNGKLSLNDALQVVNQLGREGDDTRVEEGQAVLKTY